MVWLNCKLKILLKTKAIHIKLFSCDGLPVSTIAHRDEKLATISDIGFSGNKDIIGRACKFF